MKIILVGGGSGGPAAPLIAVAHEIQKQHPKADFLFVGTKSGPEQEMAIRAGFNFVSISGGKLRRYFSWKNFISPFLIGKGFFQSVKILNEFKPDCIFGTGSFIQFPMVWAGWFKGVPVLLHQQDVKPSLANVLCQLAASKITVTFKNSLSDFASSVGFFYKKNKDDKVVLTGNPFREDLKLGNKEKALKEFNLKPDFPTLLVLGGGTGAEFLNNLLKESAPQLLKTVQVIHSTGKGKMSMPESENYRPYEFINNMADAYAAADIVLCRAGISTLTELSNLKKLSIIVPMPQTHQEFNAGVMVAYDAAVVLRQNKLKTAGFVNLIRKILFAAEAQQILKTNIGKIMPHDSNKKVAELIVNLAEKH